MPNEDHIDSHEAESHNEYHSEENANVLQYNIEEYFPYNSKHDQYSCLSCEHYYIDNIKKKLKLPNLTCEVCGNEINPRSLNFYKKKLNEKKRKVKNKYLFNLFTFI